MELTKLQVKEQILNLVPKSCPSCGGALKLSEDLMHLSCGNPSCSGKFYRKLEIMAKAFEIDNIGIKVAEEMVTALDLSKLYQLYELSISDIMKVGRFQIGMATKIYNSIQSRKEITWEQFLRGIQLSRVGEGTSRELAKKIKNLDELMMMSPTKLATLMERATTDLTKIIVDSITVHREEILELANKVTIIYEEPKQVSTAAKDLSHITAVITGGLNTGSRPEFQKRYNDKYGIKFAGSVSKNTTILITNADSNSSKAVKARDIGVKVMNEQEFIDYVESL